MGDNTEKWRSVTERINDCEITLARIDERVSMIYDFGLKACKVGLGFCAVILGVDIAPIVGLI